MSVASGASTRARRRFRWTAAVTAAILLMVFVILVGALPESFRESFTPVGLFVGAGVTCASCAHRSFRSSGRRRRPWFLLAIAGIIALLGNLWAFAVSALDLPQLPIRIGDVTLVIALLLSIGGLATFPSIPRRGTDLTRMVFDGIVIGGSGMFLATTLIFPQIMEGSGSTITQLIELVLPILDVMLATFSILLVLRSGSSDRPALVLVACGFILYAISDLSYAVLNSQQPYQFGTILDFGWLAGYGLMALAARRPPDAEPVNGEELKETSPVIGTVVMFTVFVIAAVVGMTRSGRSTEMDTPLIVLWVGVLLAVAGRQVLLIIDNEALRRGLERRVLERTAELRQMTRQSDLLLTSVGDGIYGVDRNGIITFINPAAADALGYAPEDLIGTHAHDAFHGENDDGTRIGWAECSVAIAITEGRTTSAEESQYRRSSGRLIPVEVTASPLSGDGDVEGAVVVFRDVTQRREVERMKGEFVSMVSHELRTPLTSIRGSLGLLSGGAFGELQPSMKRMVGIALESSERLSRLINDILDMERIEAGMMPLDIGDHQVRQLIEAAVSQVQVLAAEAGITIEAQQTPGQVRADADRVIQTLINLLGNAIKFSSSGGTVAVSSVETGDEVEFCVHDTGPGIPEDQLDRIFERFEQGDSSDARGRGGSGLGLAISRSIVERHGGRIWAESSLGQGATFRFTMPRVPGTDGAADQRTGAAPLPGPQATMGHDSVAGSDPVASADRVTSAEPRTDQEQFGHQEASTDQEVLVDRQIEERLGGR